MNVEGFKALYNRLPHRLRRWLPGLGVAFLVYSLAGFLLAPVLVKGQMLKLLPGLAKRQVTIQKVRVNPWALSLTVRGLMLAEADGRPFASWEEFYVNFQSSSLLRRAWTFKEIRLVKPFGEVILLRDGGFNFSNILGAENPPPPKPESKPGALPRIGVFHLLITNGFFAFEDQTRRTPFRTEYRPINLNLTDFSTRPNDASPYSFHAESDAGRSVTWSGNFTAAPLGSSGEIEIAGISFPRYQPYLEEATHARIVGGAGDLKAKYAFEAGANGLSLVVTNGSFHLNDLQVRDPSTEENVAALTRLAVEGVAMNLRERTVRVGGVAFSEPKVLLRFNAEDQLNLISLQVSRTNQPAGSEQTRPSEARSWEIGVDKISIARAAVRFEDLRRGKKFVTDIDPIAVEVTGFSSRPGAEMDYRVDLRTEKAETFGAAGKFSLAPVASAGELNLASLDLGKYVPYLADVFRGEIGGGKLGLRVPYRVELENGIVKGGVTNLGLNVKDLDVRAAGSTDPVLNIPELEVGNVAASIEEKDGRVGFVRLQGGAVRLRRDKAGAVNLLELAAPSAGQAGDPVAAPVADVPAKKWKVRLEEFSLTNYGVRFEDAMPRTPAAVEVDQIAVTASGLSSESQAPFQAAVSFRLNQGGTLSAQGGGTLNPTVAAVTVAVTNLNLNGLQSYVAERLDLVLSNASFNLGGVLRLQPAGQGKSGLEFQGDLGLDNFMTASGEASREFILWDGLSIRGIDVGLEPNRLKVEGINWTGLKANFAIEPDGELNLKKVLRTAASQGEGTQPGEPASVDSAVSKSAEAPPSEAPAGSMPIEVNEFKLENAGLGFEDRSVQPGVQMGIQELNATVRGLSTSPGSVADVNLAGKVNEQSPLSVEGRINPFGTNLVLDLVITNSNIQLTPLTPYFEKYAGYPLNRGRLSAGLKYSMAENQLKAENKIRIDQLTLGNKVESPDATQLPVKLGIALLKDREGRIELDVPVAGRMDDPQFRIGSVVLQVVGNLITKAAASPFSLLGGLVGGGEELSYVEFAPGSANLTDAEMEKLVKLTKALVERPALGLDLEGAIDPALDKEALASRKLHAELRARKLQELGRSGASVDSAEGLVLQPLDQHRLLRGLVQERFGTNLQAFLGPNEAMRTGTNSNLAGLGVFRESARGKIEQAEEQPKQSRWRRLFRRSKEGADPSVGSEASAARGAVDPVLQGMPLEALERAMASHIAIGSDELEALMAARAKAVHEFLLGSGQIAGDRIFLGKPKAVGADYRGAARVNLSLN